MSQAAIMPKIPRDIGLVHGAQDRIREMWQTLEGVEVSKEQQAQGLEYAKAHGLELPESTKRFLGSGTQHNEGTKDSSANVETMGYLEAYASSHAEKSKKAKKPKKNRKTARALAPLYREIRALLKEIDTELGAAEKQRILNMEAIQNDDAPLLERKLHVQGGPKTSELSSRIRALHKLRGEVETIGRTATALRGESSVEQLGLMFQIGAGKGIPFIGWGGGYLLPGFTARDKVTGKREYFVRTYFQLLLPPVNLGKVPGKKGFSAGLLLGWVGGSRDQMIGDNVSAGIPGIAYGGAYTRKGTPGFQGGFYPTLGLVPIDPVLGMAIEHPDLNPVIAPWLGKASQFLDDTTEKVKSFFATARDGYKRDGASGMWFDMRERYGIGIELKLRDALGKAKGALRSSKGSPEGSQIDETVPEESGAPTHRCFGPSPHIE